MTDCDYFFKTAKPTAVGISLKSPALRGFVGGLRALATAACYIFERGYYAIKHLQNRYQRPLRER